MQPRQYDLRCPSEKDNSPHAAVPLSNLDAAILMRSAETELQLRATASEIAAPKPHLDARTRKNDLEALSKSHRNGARRARGRHHHRRVLKVAASRRTARLQGKSRKRAGEGNPPAWPRKPTNSPFKVTTHSTSRTSTCNPNSSRTTQPPSRNTQTYPAVAEQRTPSAKKHKASATPTASLKCFSASCWQKERMQQNIIAIR